MTERDHSLTQPQSPPESPPRAGADTAPDENMTPGENEQAVEKAAEVGGPSGPEPTRFGDWERKGRCIDF